jgi:Tol biopolymer transport system component
MKIFLLLTVLSINAIAQQKKNNYFNQTPPGNTPKIFAAGIISDEFGNRDMAISPLGDELFYTLQFQSGRGFSTILQSKKVNGKWTQPEVATFCGKYNDLEPAFSPDGSKLYFVSSRPTSGVANKDFDIWYVTKMNGVWNTPINPGMPVNTNEDEYYPSITKTGNVYFTRAVQGREEDIMLCEFKNNQYDTAVSLPDEINSGGDEFNAFVDPDEKFIIFTGYKRKGAYAAGDLYISKKNERGEWTEAIDLGNVINQPGLNYCPYISPDKKYFFFTSNRGGVKAPFAEQQNVKSLYSKMHSTLNGADNIYWMEAKTIIEINNK